MSLYVNGQYGQDTPHLDRLTLRLDGFASLHGALLRRPDGYQANHI